MTLIKAKYLHLTIRGNKLFPYTFRSFDNEDNFQDQSGQDFFIEELEHENWIFSIKLFCEIFCSLIILYQTK